MPRKLTTADAAPERVQSAPASMSASRAPLPAPPAATPEMELLTASTGSQNRAFMGRCRQLRTNPCVSPPSAPSSSSATPRALSFRSSPARTARLALPSVSMYRSLEVDTCSYSHQCCRCLRVRSASWLAANDALSSVVNRR